MAANCSTVSWTENVIRRFAGVMILGSLALGWWVHPGWFGLTTFVGLQPGAVVLYRLLPA